jgi:hypothetical protein
MKNWSDYFDSNGLLTQKNRDGGDTPSHEGLAWLAAWFKGPNFPSPIDFLQFLGQILLPSNLLIRNPINYNNPNDSSRDQYRSVAIACIFYSQLYTLKQMYKALPRNSLGWPSYPNGDTFSPQDYAIFNTCHWPLRFIGDFFELLGIITLVFWTTRKPNFISRLLGKLWWPFIAMNSPNAQGVQGSLRGPDYTSDDLGAIMTLILGREFNGTFLNRLSVWIYAKFRPNGPQWALDNYFSADEDPPVNELYELVLPMYFKR